MGSLGVAKTFNVGVGVLIILFPIHSLASFSQHKNSCPRKYQCYDLVETKRYLCGGYLCDRNEEEVQRELPLSKEFQNLNVNPKVW